MKGLACSTRKLCSLCEGLAKCAVRRRFRGPDGPEAGRGPRAFRFRVGRTSGTGAHQTFLHLLLGFPAVGGPPQFLKSAKHLVERHPAHKQDTSKHRTGADVSTSVLKSRVLEQKRRRCRSFAPVFFYHRPAQGTGEHQRINFGGQDVTSPTGVLHAR